MRAFEATAFFHWYGLKPSSTARFSLLLNVYTCSLVFAQGRFSIAPIIAPISLLAYAGRAEHAAKRHNVGAA